MIDAPASRNAPCPCGSGRRYKHCHGAAGVGPDATPGPGGELDAVRAFAAQGRFDDAIVAGDRLLAEVPDDLAVLRVVGEIAALAGDHERAKRTWTRVSALAGDDAEASFHLGNLARTSGDAAAAIEHFERARQLAPSHSGVLNNLGLALEGAGRMLEAEAVFRRALATAPQSFEPLANLAQNLFQQRRHAAALDHFERLVGLFPVDAPEIWANRGVCLRVVGDPARAAESFERAFACGAANATLYLDHAILNIEAQRFDVAARSLEQCLAMDPDRAEALSALLFCRQNLVDWRDFEPLSRRVVAHAAAAREGDPVSPFNFLTIADDPALALTCAQRWARTWLEPPAAAPPLLSGARIRIGFVSFDFHDHPVGRLVVELIERLDRRRFDVTLYALGPARDDALRARLRGAADTFVAHPRLDVDKLAAAIRDASIDVLVDLGGYTGHSPAELFVRRPAPIQLQFLGYTGTMGTTAYDFIVADAHCIRDGDRRHYAEAPLYIEPCYLPSDSTRPVASEPLERADHGLPADAIVLCAFGPLYKVLPTMFDVWMRLLREHRSAILWLRDAEPPVRDRLAREASLRGVTPARIVFAPIDAPPRYLARFRLADVALDTAPFGSHTTVNDALFAGVPVVTLDGATFAARASASQLLAAGLGELVARDHDDYFRIADRLLREPSALRSLARRLRTPASPLFDMQRYARAFEAAIERAIASAASA